MPDFDGIRIVKKFYNELNKLPFYSGHTLGAIRIYALLNRDREPIKEHMKSVPNLKGINLDNISGSLMATNNPIIPPSLNPYNLVLSIFYLRIKEIISSLINS